VAGSVESKTGKGVTAREESALNMFRQMDLKGSIKDDSKLQTVHQNTINTLRVYEEAGGRVKKFSCKNDNLPWPLISTANIFLLRLNSQWCGWKSRGLDFVMPQHAARRRTRTLGTLVTKSFVRCLSLISSERGVTLRHQPLLL
jgi:hypothetical protein